MNSRTSQPHGPPGAFILPPPEHIRVDPPRTDEQRARAVAMLDRWEREPIPDSEPDWDVDALFPPGRVR